jgi:ligand-binding SRPBCC domain-containing protein
VVSLPPRKLKMSQTFHASQWVAFPVELVFAFFANPANLPHLMPQWQQARIENSRLTAPIARPISSDPELRFQSPAAGVGSEIAVSFRPFPGIALRVNWVAKITEFEWNSHFCDEQVKGPLANWSHRHTIRSDERAGVVGCLVSDDVSYALPFGPLGAIVNDLFVRRQMESTFTHRRRQLERILPVAAKQAAKRI